MGKQSRRNKDGSTIVEFYVMRFDEPNKFGEVFTRDTQISIPNRIGQLIHKDDGVMWRGTMPNVDIEKAYNPMMSQSSGISDIDIDWLMKNGLIVTGRDEYSIIPKDDE